MILIPARRVRVVVLETSPIAVSALRSRLKFMVKSSFDANKELPDVRVLWQTLHFTGREIVV